MAGFAAAAVIAAGFAVVANQERRRAEVEASVNRSQVLAAAAIEAMGEDDQLALLLGLEAADVSLAANGEVLPEVADALHRSLRASRLESAVSLDSLPMGRTVLLAASSSGLVAVSSTGDTVELDAGVAADAAGGGKRASARGSGFGSAGSRTTNRRLPSSCSVFNCHS